MQKFKKYLAELLSCAMIFGTLTVPTAAAEYEAPIEEEVVFEEAVASETPVEAETADEAIDSVGEEEADGEAVAIWNDVSDGISSYKTIPNLVFKTASKFSSLYVNGTEYNAMTSGTNGVFDSTSKKLTSGAYVEYTATKNGELDLAVKFTDRAFYVLDVTGETGEELLGTDSGKKLSGGIFTATDQVTGNTKNYDKCSLTFFAKDETTATKTDANVSATIKTEAGHKYQVGMTGSKIVVGPCEFTKKSIVVNNSVSHDVIFMQDTTVLATKKVVSGNDIDTVTKGGISASDIEALPIIETGKIFRGWTLSDNNAIYSSDEVADMVVNAPMTFTASFSLAKTYALEFYNAAGSIIKTVNVVENLKPALSDLPTAPEKSGYQFLGWQGEALPNGIATKSVHTDTKNNSSNEKIANNAVTESKKYYAVYAKTTVLDATVKPVTIKDGEVAVFNATKDYPQFPADKYSEYDGTLLEEAPTSYADGRILFVPSLTSTGVVRSKINIHSDANAKLADGTKPGLTHYLSAQSTIEDGTNGTAAYFRFAIEKAGKAVVYWKGGGSGNRGIVVRDSKGDKVFEKVWDASNAAINVSEIDLDDPGEYFLGMAAYVDDNTRSQTTAGGGNFYIVQVTSGEPVITPPEEGGDSLSENGISEEAAAVETEKAIAALNLGKRDAKYKTEQNVNVYGAKGDTVSACLTIKKNKVKAISINYNKGVSDNFVTLNAKTKLTGFKGYSVAIVSANEVAGISVKASTKVEKAIAKAEKKANKTLNRKNVLAIPYLKNVESYNLVFTDTASKTKVTVKVVNVRFDKKELKKVKLSKDAGVSANQVSENALPASVTACATEKGNIITLGTIPGKDRFVGGYWIVGKTVMDKIGVTTPVKSGKVELNAVVNKDGTITFALAKSNVKKGSIKLTYCLNGKKYKATIKVTK